MALDIKGKHILVTGGNGFLGANIVTTLQEHGVKSQNIFAPKSSELDLTKWKNCVQAVKDCDIVIHNAGVTGGIEMNRTKGGEIFWQNASMNINLMEAARQENVEKFVAVGTVCEYPKFAPVPFREEELWNGYPEETNAPYGLSKKLGLVQGQAYRAQYGFNAVHLLMVNLYGPRDHFDPVRSHVIPALVLKIGKAQSEGAKFIEAWGTGAASREFLYVEDAAEAIVLALENYDKGEPVNIGASMEITIKELVELLCELMEFKGEIRWDVTKPDGQPRRKLDVSKAEVEFGFKSKTSFREGLQKTIDWYRQSQEVKK